jgi:hypothetical protein
MDSMAGLAQVALGRGNPFEAKVHVDEILSYLANHSLGYLYWPPRPFRVYLTCYRVLEANGDPHAQDVLETAFELLQERAAKISDETERRSYLENVAANREIAEQYERLRGAV